MQGGGENKRAGRGRNCGWNGMCHCALAAVRKGRFVYRKGRNFEWECAFLRGENARACAEKRDF